MYLEFLLRRAHSRRRVERRYWSGESLYSRTTCSNSVIVGVTGPMGSGPITVLGEYSAHVPVADVVDAVMALGFVK